MTTPLLHLTLPDADENEPAHFAPLLIALEGMIKLNEWHLARGLRRAEKGLEAPPAPLYVSGVKLGAPAANREDWRDVLSLYQFGAGNSGSLAAARCAELRIAGIPAEPALKWQRLSRSQMLDRGYSARDLGAAHSAWVIHCAVQLPDGRIEDPSKIISGSEDDCWELTIKPLFHLTLPDPDINEAAHFAPLLIVLNVMCDVNQWHIERDIRRGIKGQEMKIPPLYASLVVYKEDDPGHEDWRDLFFQLKRRRGDCDNLVGWRVGELRAIGVWAEPVIKWQWVPREVMMAQGYPGDMLPGGGVWLVHCEVKHPDGRIEDPSKILGMGGEYMEHV